MVQLERVGNDRQVREAPLTALLVEFSRQAELDEVADGRRDHILVVLEVIVLLGQLAERASEIDRDGGLFGDDERFFP